MIDERGETHREKLIFECEYGKIVEILPPKKEDTDECTSTSIKEE